MSDQAADTKKPDEPQTDPASTDPASTASEAAAPSEDGQKPPSARSDAFLGSYGNRAGSTINSALSPIGGPLGKGLETATRPVGNVVDALVGGVMRSGGAHGEIAGVGAGNMDGKKDAEKEKLREPLGGEEQTGENPLGLRGGGG